MNRRMVAIVVTVLTLIVTCCFCPFVLDHTIWTIGGLLDRPMDFGYSSTLYDALSYKSGGLLINFQFCCGWFLILATAIFAVVAIFVGKNGNGEG